MRFEVSPEEIRRAKIPHELFLTNLIGNHILMAVAAGGVAGSLPWLLALVPVISVAILGFTLWRARRSIGRDPWYVMCHWQVCARRSRIFLAMLALVLTSSLLGWISYSYGGMMKEAVIALVIGTGIMPIMLTVLVLVIVESDVLYHAHQARLPDWVVTRFPNPQARVLPETGGAPALPS